jgi:hypothetical protein
VGQKEIRAPKAFMVTQALKEYRDYKGYKGTKD